MWAKDLLSQLGEGCLRQLAKRPEGGCQAKDRKGKRIKGAAPKRPNQRGRFWAGGWLLSFSHESAPIVGLTLYPTKKRAPTDGRGLSVSCSPLQSEEQAHQWIHRGKGAAGSWWKKYPGLWRRSTQGG